MGLLQIIFRCLRAIGDADSVASLVIWLLGDTVVSGFAGYGMAMWAVELQQPAPVIVATGLSGFTVVYATILSVFVFVRTRRPEVGLSDREADVLARLRQRIPLMAEFLITWWPDKANEAKNIFDNVQREQHVVWYDKEAREAMRQFLIHSDVIFRAGEMPEDPDMKEDLLNKIAQSADALGKRINKILRNWRPRKADK